MADDNLHGQQLAVEHVIQKVFKKYAITIKVPDKIRHAFQSKLWCMRGKRAQLGGIKRKQQVDKWKTSF